MSDDRCWEVVGSISGNCVYVKQHITQIEAKHFIEHVTDENGAHLYFWPDGEAIRLAHATAWAFWMRRMAA